MSNRCTDITYRLHPNPEISGRVWAFLCNCHDFENCTCKHPAGAHKSLPLLPKNCMQIIMTYVRRRDQQAIKCVCRAYQWLRLRRITWDIYGKPCIVCNKRIRSKQHHKEFPKNKSRDWVVCVCSCIAHFGCTTVMKEFRIIGAQHNLVCAYFPKELCRKCVLPAHTVRRAHCS